VAKVNGKEIHNSSYLKSHRLYDKHSGFSHEGQDRSELMMLVGSPKRKEALGIVAYDFKVDAPRTPAEHLIITSPREL
jgi:hypothetical protein